ncbi:cytochrome c biogenesis protein CcsA [Arcobacteraceae bacterium]|nr:cytochrome c biogenesis protein CcsA [Arcobacteraceae bacterium]
MQEISIVKKTANILFSYWTTLFALFLLAGGAIVATFIENDFGTSTARVLVYNNLWYEFALILAIVNLIGVINRRKMWKQKAKFIFHSSFVVILIGAGMTRYMGYEGIMQIKEGQTQNQMSSLEPFIQVTILSKGKQYYTEFQKEFSALSSNKFNYTVEFEDKILNLSLDSYTFAKKGLATMNLIGTKVTLGDESQVTKLVGQRGQTSPIIRDLKFKDDVSVYLTYGSKPLTIPFAIKLNDFQLDRYPGSKSPSSYASEITLIDEVNDIKFDYRIFMNSTLQYGGFQFFQSSYDPDEKGTVLSVNNDPGTIPTYLGYFLLTLGLLMNMFDKKSRFSKLIKYSKEFNATAMISVLLVFSNISANAEAKIESSPTVKYLESYKVDSLETADKFSHLVVQSNSGRMKPIDTLSRDILHKLTRKSEFLGMNSNQILLGMLSRPEVWRNIEMLKITTPKLKKLLGLEESRKYVAFSEIFSDTGIYKLKDIVSNVNSINVNERGTFEKDVLRLDERLSIAYMVYYGYLFQIFPQPSDTKDITDTRKWFNPVDAMNKFNEKDSKIIKMLVGGFIDGLVTEKYEEVNKYISLISQYQEKIGKEVIPSRNIIDSEILFNKAGIFPKLTLVYILVGIIIFFVSFLTVFNKKWHSTKVNTTFFVILAILFSIHTFGMGHRWYISGHAPWSDTYESLVYIAWSAMFAGLFFFRKSLMALSATVIMAGVFMFTAHLSGIDPQITNLVPVLKSYWLTIHVSIITGSYGFLAIGAMLGFMSLILFIFRNPEKPHIDNTIKHITTINEASLILGLAALVIGNFLGGIWANESWGRYWGWDPKETWAYISIITYIIVLHLRMIPKLSSPYIFAVASTLAFSSILMTYFGVNFYLSGLHSYATGDPVPIPTWVYVLTAMVFVVIAIASRKRDLPKAKF